MISRRTIYSLFLVLLLAIGIRLYTLDRVDDCTPYFQHMPNASSTMFIYLGSQPVEVSCEVWLPRQTQGVMLACLFDGCAAAVFLFSLLLDIVETRNRKKLGLYLP